MLKGLQYLKHRLVRSTITPSFETRENCCRNLSESASGKDHMAKPPIASGEIADWAGALKEVATYPNVWCKLSGLVTEANWTSWTTEDLRLYVERALEFFGPKRLMFGSDWPVCLLVSSYLKVLESFQALLADLAEEDRNRIFGENATEFYELRGEEDLACASSR